MKKVKGQSVVQFVTITALVLGVILGSLHILGQNLSELFKNKNPAKIFNDRRTLQYESPQNLVTNVAVTVAAMAVKSPVEKVVKANVTNATFLLTSGKSGCLKDFDRAREITQIMQEYINQLLPVVNSMPNTAARANYLAALNAYKVAIDAAVLKLMVAGITKLEIKMALIELCIKIAKTEALTTNLKANFTAYIPTLAASNKKTVIDLYTNDLLNFAKDIDYETKVSLYQVIPDSKKPTPAGKAHNFTQDQILFNALNAGFAGYTNSQRDHYQHEIDIDTSKSYSKLAPDTYTDAKLCTTLGGSGNPCNI
ncbi:MAG: hypothetical protein A2039_03955 [Candidatus Melainabacteria bacterium GWA2_34_9]|nr:MAG: hypothetical protein A2039_03955 [Candidatus Melainabacteria bacterium GWA2_34_9]